MERVEKVALLYLFLSMDCGKQEQFACYDCPFEHCRKLWNETRLLQGYLASGKIATPDETNNTVSSHTSNQNPNSFYLVLQMLTGPSH